MSNLSTFFPSGGTSPLGGTFEATASGAISDGDPVVLNTDGTVSAITINGGATIAAGAQLFVVGQQNDAVYKYNLSTAFDISTASYSEESFNVSAQETNPNGIAFSSNGLKMFVIGYNTDEVEEYSLVTGYNISTASYVQSFSVAAQEVVPTDLAFNSDGTKMFVLGDNGNDVNEYALSTAYDISTASYTRNFSVGTQDTSPWGMDFSPDGTKMFIAGRTNNTVFAYNLSTGFDLSTASYASQSFSTTSQHSGLGGVTFNTDGTKMFTSSDTSRSIYEYNLSTAFNVSTASYSGNSVYVNTADQYPYNIVFNLQFNEGSLVGTNVTGYGNYIGIADGAYADGATVTVQVAGAIDDAQSGLQAGYKYYVQNDGTLATTPDFPSVIAGYALSPTKLLVRGAYGTLFT